MRRLPPSVRRRARTSLGLHVEALEARRLLATITVTGTGDTIASDGIVTLREAITAANTNAASGDAAAGDTGLDTIAFAIPGAGVRIIRPTSALPPITEAVTIDGYTQPGAARNTDPGAFNGRPLVELDGSAAGLGVSGLTLNAGNSVVRGLAIYQFRASPGGTTLLGGHAIVSQGGGGNRIEGNLLGTNVARTAGGNEGAGVFLDNAANNTVGGTSAAARNILIGNRNGVDITGQGARGNRVQGNLIGLDANNVAGPNFLSGVTIRDGASGNSVGGANPFARNVISGNQIGVLITGVSGVIPGGNFVQGNFIGTNIVGTEVVPNSQGVLITSSGGNLIGGLTSTPGTGAGNVITGGLYGVVITGDSASGNLVQGNLIGTNAAGTAVPSPGGIFYAGALIGGRANTVGGPDAQARNVVSGSSRRAGIALAESGGHLVQNNFIGTDVTGTADLGNGGGGIQVNAPGDVIRNNVIAFNRNVIEEGGDPVGGGVHVIAGLGNAILRNSIFGNQGAGIILDGSSPSLPKPPVLTSATGTVIAGTLTTLPNAAVHLEFFATPAAGGGSGSQGETFLGTTDVTSDGSGLAGFTFVPAGGVPAGALLTATATGPNGTSQFSEALNGSVAPVAPTNVVPFLQTLGNGAITLTILWSHPSPVGGAVTFNVYRSTNPGGEGPVPFAPQLSTRKLTDTTVEPGKTYYYQVSAVQNGVESARSAETHASLADVPPAPRLSAHLSNIEPGSVFVRSTVSYAPGTTAPPPNSTFRVYRSTAPGQEGAIPYSADAGRFVTSDPIVEAFARLATPRTFYYQVSVVQLGVEGPRSNEVKVTVPALALPPAPRLSAHLSNIEPGSVFVRSTVSYAPGTTAPPPNSTFRVYRSTAPGQEGAIPYSADAGRFVTSDPIVEAFARLATPRTFYYQVSVVQLGVEGPRSNEVKVTVPALALPPAPRLSAHLSNIEPGSVFVRSTVSYAPGTTAPPPNSTFRVYRSTAPGQEGAIPYSADAGRFVTSDPIVEAFARLATPRTFYYQVSVVQLGVEGPRSNEVKVTVPALALPPAPRLSAHLSNIEPGSVFVRSTVSYAPGTTAPPPNSTFRVYRSTAPGQEGAIPYSADAGRFVTSDPIVEAFARLATPRTFYYQVSVVQLGVEGPRSNEVKVTVPALALPKPNLFGYFAVGGPTYGHFYLQPSFPAGSLAGFPNASVRIYRSSVSQGEGASPIDSGSVSAPWRSNYLLPRSAQTFYFQESLVVNGVEGPRSNEIQVTLPALPVTKALTVVRSVSVAIGPFGQVAEVVSQDGTLTQFDAAGAHRLLGGVLSASVAFGPFGQVAEVVSQDGTLTQFDAAGAHRLLGGVLSASVAFGPFGQVVEVVSQDGTLTQFDAAGAHRLLGGVLSAGVAFGPFGQVAEVVSQDGTLTQFDAAGAHRLLGGVLSASVAFGPAGEVLLVVSQDGTYTQFDAAGAHSLGTIL